LQHPNIVGVHETGEVDGVYFFSMDYVQGTDAAELAREKAAAPRIAATLIERTARAIEHVNNHGILHRDLKPSNVLIHPDGRPIITDFGLAKSLRDERPHEPPRTLSGDFIGTPAYMSPEQADGRPQDIGQAADVYGLGTVLYYLLTCRPPFDPKLPSWEILWQVKNLEPRPPRSYNPAVPADLQTICLRCLEKDPRRRYATAGALADDLQRFLNHEPIRARRVTLAIKARRWCQRYPVVASLLAVLTVAMVAATVLAFTTRSALNDELAANRVQEIQRMRLLDCGAGWAADAWGKARDAAQASPNSRLRDEAAAILIGLDATPIKRFGQGTTSLAFNARGDGLILGGVPPEKASRSTSPGTTRDCGMVRRLVN
jgi:hypothetical protein